MFTNFPTLQRMFARNGQSQSGMVSFEFVLILPLFAALTFFVLGVGKTLIASIHSASEARTAAWMQARLEVDIPASSYRIIAKKAAGMEIQPPLCLDGASSRNDDLKDEIPNEDFTGEVENLTTVKYGSNKSLFASVTKAAGGKFIRTQCQVFDQKIARSLGGMEVFIVQETAIVPNRKTWRFDESPSKNNYDISCGYDSELRRGLRGSFGKFDEMFPDIFPRAKNGCNKSK